MNVAVNAHPLTVDRSTSDLDMRERRFVLQDAIVVDRSVSQA